MSIVVNYQRLGVWRDQLPADCKLVVTNGCFDLLHPGHVHLLKGARERGDMLLVGINDDQGARALKGARRPIMNQDERAEMLGALRCVDAVCIFAGKRATNFLLRARPVIYVKGGDYTLDTLELEEAVVLEAAKSQVEFEPFMVGQNTTQITERILGGVPAEGLVGKCPICYRDCKVHWLDCGNVRAYVPIDLAHNDEVSCSWGEGEKVISACHYVMVGPAPAPELLDAKQKTEPKGKTLMQVFAEEK